MPSDWAIKKVLELRQRQMQQNAEVELGDPSGNRFDALIGEMLDEVHSENEKLKESLAEMLFFFDHPRRDEWLNDAGWQHALKACDAARALVPVPMRRAVNRL